MLKLALFRSCLRKEYRDQVIKMLRAVPGEYTRTAYRFQWIEESLQPMFDNGEPFEAISFLVDQNLENALPCRKLTVVEPPIRDDRIGVYRFVFEIGEFVAIPKEFNGQLAKWREAEELLPPTKFVSRLSKEWLELQDIRSPESGDTWKRSIDFLTQSWSSFDNTVFFRPHGRWFSGRPHGPICDTGQSLDTAFSFVSYNPHLDDRSLSKRSIHASVSGVIGDVQKIPPLMRDGQFEITAKFLEAGNGTLQVEVRPDEQFSTYVPISLVVSSNDQLDPSGPRILGPEWQRFLAELVEKSDEDRPGVSNLLDRLAVVFPGDPELMIQRGRLHMLVGEHAAARDEFAKALSIRNDSRAVWWSLISEIRLGHRSAVEDLLNRLDLSSSETNLALFEQLVSAMLEVPNRTVDWFAELPGLVLGEDKALRVLISMGAGDRDEASSTAVFRALAVLNPPIAIQHARTVLHSHPDWYSLRRDIARLAAISGFRELAEDEVEVLVHYIGQDVDEYLDLVMNLQVLIHPQRLPSLLIANAIRLASNGDVESLRVSQNLAYIAADRAAANGDFLEAQFALQFLEMQIAESEHANHQYRDPINQIVRRMARVDQVNPQLSRLGEMYLSEIAAELKEHFEGTRLVVFGGESSTERTQSIADDLGLSDIVWLGWSDGVAPNPNRLREFVDADSTVLIVSLDDGLVSENVRRWLVTSKISNARCVNSRLSIYQTLRAIAVTTHDQAVFVPVSCRSAFDWAVANCPNLEFLSGADLDLADLDRLQNSSHVALRIKTDLEMLNRYAEERLSGRANSGLHNWAKVGGFQMNRLSLLESETTNNNPRFRSARVFKVDKSIDSSGFAYMPAHTKLPGSFPSRPSIHFSVDYLPTYRKILIGYVGPHLENSQSN